MSDYILPIKCKDYDSYLTFLGRLIKVGDKYIVKNDCYICTEKNNWDTGKIPGRHIVKDPFFCSANDDYYTKDGIYQMDDIRQLIAEIKRINEEKPELRKNISYVKSPDYFGFYLESPTGEHLVIQLGKLITEDIPEHVQATANQLTTFQDLIDPIDNMVGNEWTELDIDTMISLRDEHIIRLKKVIGDRLAETRVARSLFILAGVTRKGTPLAQMIKYAFLPSDQSDVAMLRCHAIYKCGQTTNFSVNCIHEYLILMYRDAEEDTDE